MGRPRGKHRRTTIQFPQSQTVPRAICFGCALRHHDFKNGVGRELDDGAFLTLLPEARIDGRRYRLLRHIGTQGMVCSECNRRALSVYVSME